MSVDSINQAGLSQAIQQPLVTSQAKKDFAPSNPDYIIGKQASEKSATNHIQPVDQVQLKQSTALRNLDTVRTIEQMHNRLNELVKGVRESNEGLAKAANTVERMNTTLQTLAKNYPPFPIDSQERRDLLMSYISLRKEIQQLTVPPPPPEIYEKIQPLWDQFFAENGKINAETVPQLDVSSTDSSVSNAAASISKISDQIASLSNNITNTLVMR